MIVYNMDNGDIIRDYPEMSKVVIAFKRGIRTHYHHYFQSYFISVVGSEDYVMFKRFFRTVLNGDINANWNTVRNDLYMANVCFLYGGIDLLCFSNSSMRKYNEIGNSLDN